MQSIDTDTHTINRYMRHAFTLVELSIVLVIIGLILGGLLVGNDLIQQATLRKVITQTEQIFTSINAFKLKYNCIPGDCINANQFSAGAINGNGNGWVEYHQPNIYTGEGINIWHHLSSTGLIAGNYPGVVGEAFDLTNVPPGPFGANSMYRVVNTYMYSAPYITYGAGTGYFPASQYPITASWLLLSGYTTGVSYHAATILLPIDMQNLDSKIDDGRPFTGIVGAGDSANCLTSSNWNSNNYDAVYKVTNTSTKDCVFMRRFPQ